MSLRFSYSLIAPVYDLVVRRALERSRRESLQRLPRGERRSVLVSGIGTGLDLPHLPPEHRYVGLDITPSMLERARRQSRPFELALVEGDSQRLPFADASFDHAILHLIVAVVPNPLACLRETARVLRPGGRCLIVDKFLRPGEPARLRRAASPLVARLATRLDVVFEDLLAQVPQLRLDADTPALAGGWFRRIELTRRDALP